MSNENNNFENSNNSENNSFESINFESDKYKKNARASQKGSPATKIIGALLLVGSLGFAFYYINNLRVSSSLLNNLILAFFAVVAVSSFKLLRK